MAAQEIQYIERSQLDVTKWDACMDTSPNGLIYGYSFYLDAMAKHWDALVLGDYEAIMPLTWNRKWGFKYLYQPPFTQQLGIFSRQQITPSRIKDFVKKLEFHFRFGEIFLNHSNAYPMFSSCPNFIVSLSSGYSQVYSNYRSDALKNLRRSLKFGLTYRKDVDVATALTAYRTEYGKKIFHLKMEDFHRFEKLCDVAAGNSELIVRGVAGGENDLLAVSVLLQKRNRLYFIQSTTFAEGRKAEANYYLVDQIVQEFAGADFLLDFEGSSIPGIAHFYRNFGSINQPYFFYRFNHLPFMIRWMKG